MNGRNWKITRKIIFPKKENYTAIRAQQDFEMFSRGQSGLCQVKLSVRNVKKMQSDQLLVQVDVFQVETMVSASNPIG